MEYSTEHDFAIQQDKQDPMREFRDAFYIPEQNGKPVIYFCGNSLGLQPKTVSDYIQQELDDWKNLAVKGHFSAKNPWYYYQNFLTKPLCNLLGAKEKEVIAMNALSVNLHLLMVSFYQPEKHKYKIIVDTPIFPSDRYAIESQAEFHGYKNALIEVDISACSGREANEKLEQAIETHKDETALVLLAGVNYYSGHFYDHKTLSETARKHKLTYGIDLAHTIGNLPLKLHEWDVDFATWCSYKYLNSSPGGVSGIFVHEKHHQNHNLPKFKGWWGTDEEKRFQMEITFIPQEGAGSWQLSNAPVLGMAAQRASLEIFEQAGIENLRKKSIRLTAYLEFLLNKILEKHPGSFSVLTPNEAEYRGCQLSLYFPKNGKQVFEDISAKGVIADWRKPDVMRVAPVPLYNSFEDVYHFCKLLENGIERW